MPTVQHAIALATKAHSGQTDKAGKPYVEHVLRVMNHMTTDEEKIVAVLHDVVEDTMITLNDLRAHGYAPAIVDAVDCLTRRKGETYAAFVDRLKPNAIARKVKMADLEDNMDFTRLANPGPHDLKRIDKYRMYWLQLAALEAGKNAWEPVFHYYAMPSKSECLGLFVFSRMGGRLDTLAWHHPPKAWVHDPYCVARYQFSDLDAEEVSREEAEELARAFGAVVPPESEFMRITDETEAKLQRELKSGKG